MNEEALLSAMINDKPKGPELRALIERLLALREEQMRLLVQLHRQTYLLDAGIDWNEVEFFHFDPLLHPFNTLLTQARKREKEGKDDEVDRYLIHVWLSSGGTPSASRGEPKHALYNKVKLKDGREINLERPILSPSYRQRHPKRD